MKYPLTLLALSLTSCASLPNSPSSNRTLETDAPLPTETRPAAARLAASANASVKPVQRRAIEASHRKTPQDASILRDPAFRQRILRSYLAESNVEPSLDKDERKAMQEILTLITPEEGKNADLPAAQKLVAENRKQPGASAVFDFTAGNLFFQQENLTQAISAYQAAVEKFPQFRRAWSNLGQIYYRQGKFKQAAQTFTKVIELGANKAINFGLLGVAHSRTGDDMAAESAFRMASMLEPRNVDWRMGMAESFFKQQRYADAANLFGKLITDQPDRADLWLAQGEAYARLKRLLDAAKNFEVVDRLGGSTQASLYNLADIYANKGLHELAVGCYLRALKKKPTNGPSRCLRAARYLCGTGALKESGRLVKGIESTCGETLDADSKKELLRIRARLAVANGAGDEEAKILQQIVDLDPLDGDALILLGQHARRSGNNEKAVLYFERAANLEKFEADACVRHAQLLVGEREYAQALRLLKRAQTLKPRDNIQEFMDRIERAANKR